MYKNEFEIDVLRCFNALFKKLGFISLITVLAFFVGLGLTLNKGVDQYTSTATVYAAANGSYNEAATAVTAMNAYLDVATSNRVCQRAALIIGRSDIDANTIKDSIEVSSSLKKTGTNSTITSFMTSSATIISINATTNDPELSRKIADAAADAYVIEMANILRYDGVKNLDNAEPGELSTNALMEAWKLRILFMVAGFLLACMIVVACEVFDKKVRTIREATIKNQLPIIGIIPDYKE